MSQPRKDPFPRAPLYGAAVAIAMAFGAVLFAGLEAPGGTAGVATGTAVAQRDLWFEDRDDGAIAVKEARAGEPVVVLPPGTNGFIRATLRGLARERRLGDLGAEAPFRLTAWDNGRLTLQDAATGRMLDLAAFGPTQVEAFARFLPPREGTP